jgi:hypothetical protein
LRFETNRDTLYSLSVFDLDAGPVTVTLPNAGQRFISMQVIDEDQPGRTPSAGRRLAPAKVCLWHETDMVRYPL